MSTKRPCEFFPWTRQVTGLPYLHHAYVYEGVKVVSACSHAHRSRAAAMTCATRMLHRIRRIRQEHAALTGDDK